MKKFLFTPVAFAVAIISVSSCKKEKGQLPAPVPVNQKPVANATHQVLSQHAPSIVKFTNQSLRATTYQWYVGNQVVSTEQHPEILLKTAGSSTVRLIAKNSQGDSSVKDFSLAVTKHPFLFHHFEFTNDFTNAGSSGTSAGSMHFAFAADRYQKGNSALYFNGVNTFVMLPNNLTSLAPDSMSISVWFKPEDLTKSGVVFGYQSGTLNTAPVHFVPAIYYSSSRKLYLGTWKGNFAEGIEAGNILNNWVHVVIAANSKGQDIYINGEKVKTIEARANDSHMPVALLGATYSNNGLPELAQGNNYFKGWIDDVRIYKKKLTATEVKALYKE